MSKTSLVLEEVDYLRSSFLGFMSRILFCQVKDALVGTTRLSLASGGDGGGSTATLDGTRAGTASLDGLDDGHGGDVTGGDLAEDDVAAVEPAGHDGGDEELRAVAVREVSLHALLVFNV